MSWSPDQYRRFESERYRPVTDLLSALPAMSVGRAVDIGCGPGNSTEILHRRFPHGTITGMDNSPAMIDAARRRLPNAEFTVGDIAGWTDPGPFALVLANAVLQWIPHHEAVLPARLDKLAPGGSLAVQISDNWNEPAHRLMWEVSADQRWASRLSNASDVHANRHDAKWYYRLLRPPVR